MKNKTTAMYHPETDPPAEWPIQVRAAGVGDMIKKGWVKLALKNDLTQTETTEDKQNG